MDKKKQLEILCPGKTIIGLSGGKDSVCLTHLLLCALGASRLCAVHVNHSIRAEAYNDALFVEKLCKTWGIPCRTVTIDVNSEAKRNKLSTETQARISRLRAIGEVAKEMNADNIALAHHADDRAESILMHIFRGCGLSGLVGMKERENNIVRPILDWSRADVEEYIEKNGLEFVDDCTNFSDEYNRNFLRLEVVPRIEERYPGVKKHINRLSDFAYENEKLLDSLMDFSLIEQISDSILLKKEAFDSPLIKRYIIKSALRVMPVDIESTHIERVMTLVSAKTGSRADLVNGAIAERTADGIVFFAKKNICDAVYAFGIRSFELNGVFSVKPCALTDRECAFDLDKVPPTAVIRTRRTADKFTPFGGGTRKLKEYLIDKKIPKYIRDELALIAVDDEVLAIAGIEISAKVKIDEGTRNAVTFVKEKTDMEEV